jgi:hypothetical protein
VYGPISELGKSVSAAPNAPYGAGQILTTHKRHLVVLQGEADAETWRRQPATEAERSLEAVADWGPSEDWSDWRDAEG